MHRFLHIGLFFMALSFASVGMAANRLVASINFEDAKMSISHADKSSLDVLLDLSADKIIEKIDLVSRCGQRTNTSDHRLALVYEYLLQQVPDTGQYQLIHNPIGMKSQMHDHDQCVDVIMYVLEKDVTPLDGNIAAQLFPEEFQEEALIRARENIAKAKKTENPGTVGFHEGASQPKSGDVFELRNVYFHGNSAVYKEESEESLMKLLQFMQHSEDHILLEGHVNGSGGALYFKKIGKRNPERVAYKNAKDLSLARAKSVKRFLVENGIDPARIETEGKGGADKIYRNPKNKAQEAANRRIEIIVL